MKISIEFEIDNSSFRAEDGSVARWDVGQFIAKEVRYRADCLLDDPDNSAYGSEIDLRDENGNIVGIIRKIDDEAGADRKIPYDHFSADIDIIR